MPPIPTPFDAAVDEIRTKIGGLQSMLSDLLRLQHEYRNSAPVDAGPAWVSTRIVAGVPPPAAPSLPSIASRLSAEREERAPSVGIFHGLSIGDAAVKFLETKRTPRSNLEIANALEFGGVTHNSKDFANTVRAALGQRDDFVRVGREKHWALAKWEMTPAPKQREHASRKERVVSVMKRNSVKPWTAEEVARILNDKRKLVQVTMGLLRRDGVLNKERRGYSLAHHDSPEDDILEMFTSKTA